MSTRLRDTDQGLNALKTRIAGMRGVSVSVGIHEAEGSEPAEGSEDVTLAEVAAFNEFGGPDNNPPQRSFLAAWSDENLDENRELFRRSAQAVVKGKLPSMAVALERLGLRFVGEIQQRIRSGIEPENADSTVERKGSSTPLIDSGQLWGSVTHSVNSKD
jgi:hypothetical protein